LGRRCGSGALCCFIIFIVYYTCDLAFRFVDCFRFGFQSIINYHRCSFCMISSLEKIEPLFPWDIHTFKGKNHLSTYVGESWRSHRVDPQRKFLLTTLLHLDGSRLQTWCSSRYMTLGGNWGAIFAGHERSEDLVQVKLCISLMITVRSCFTH
jgi:hypothetical protein